MLTGRSNGGRPDTSAPPSSIRPSSGRSKPAIIRSVVVLPEPDGPEQREELAARDVEVDAVDGGDVAVPLPQADDADVDVGRHGC